MSNHKQGVAAQSKDGSKAVYHYEGAIPPAQMMQEYSKLDPNIPNRLITMAEKEAEHRRNIDNQILKKSWYNEILRNIAGLLSVSIISYLGYLFMEKGYAAEGSHIVIAVVASLAAIFVLRHFRISKENDSK